MPRVTIDGRERRVADGVTILEAAALCDVRVPTLCNDVRLEPSGACRLCVVAVDGNAQHPVAACTTPVRDGMVVDTRSPGIEDLRRTLLTMLAREYPSEAITASPDEPFHRLLVEYGVVDQAHGTSLSELVDAAHPLIHVDLSRCISCWRCVRICEEVQGQFVWHIEGRGANSHIVADSGTTLAESSCVSCGACVDTCPTGALEDQDLVGGDVPTKWTTTTCPYCGVGCEMQVGTREGRIVAVVPRMDAPVNRGHLCVKGRYGHGFVSADDRVTHPMVRDVGGAGWRETSWDEAIDATARAFRRALDRGRDSVGVLGSARATNEDNYLFQKFARTVLGTNNVDSCARVCHAPSAAGLAAVFGTGAATSSFDDIERARTILVCGANPTENHPIVGARIRQARLAGANLIIIDPRRIELAEIADVRLRPRPGTTVALLNAMAATIVEEEIADRAWIASRVDEFDSFCEHVARYTPESVADGCGVSASDIRAAARLYATAHPAISFHGLGVTEHHQGTEGVMCLANLALLTGNVGRPGTGVNPLRGQNNVQGAAHMGCEPSRLPGYAPLAEARERVAGVWGADIPVEPGLDAMRLIDAAGTGAVSTLYVAGWDILMTQPDTNTTRGALERLDALVVQDLFLNETARELATVFLPATASFEKDGTFMNSERRIQRVRAAVPPPGDSLADWEIVCRLAAVLGRGELFPYTEPAEIWEEIRRVWLPGAGISYSRIESEGGIQWPCPSEDHPGTTTLHGTTFGAGTERAALRRIEFQPTPEAPTEDLPLVLVTGRSLFQFNAGTMTRRSGTHHLRVTDRLEISSDDAARAGVKDGELARVRSRYGEATLAVQVTERVSPGTVFATFHDPGTGINHLTGPHRDPYTNTPEYKVTAVDVTRR